MYDQKPLLILFLLFAQVAVPHLWVEPLPDKLFSSDLTQGSFGLVDDPKNQRLVLFGNLETNMKAGIAPYLIVYYTARLLCRQNQMNA